MWVLLDLFIFVTGDAAAVYSWSSISRWVDQFTAQLSSLREKISAIVTNIRAF